MPFTPYHFGPHSCVALVFKRYINLPVFVLANVVVDFEPLAVMVFNLNYPLHGYCHTFLLGSVLGIIWGGAACLLIKKSQLINNVNIVKVLFSALAGVWLHVVFDAPLYSDIRPFFPLESNPLYGILSSGAVYSICTLSFIPAVILYVVITYRKKTNQR